MRVMHVIAPGVLAGAERLVLAGCEALVARGVDAELLVIEESRSPAFARAFVAEAEVRGLRATMLGCRGRLDMTLMALIAGHARDADVIHAHGFKALVHVQAARTACPLIATWHGDTASDPRVLRYEQIGHALARKADRLVVVGRAAHRQAIALGARAEKTVICENFAPDLNRIMDAPRTRTSIPRLLFAGRLSEEKAPLVLLDALERSPRPFDLTIAGTGPLLDVVKARAEQLRARHRVDVLGWVSDVGALMERHDVLVLPSLREGLPLVVLEAVARGMPVVASDVGALSDVILDGETGLLVPPGDVDALQKGLERAAQSLDSWTSRAHALAPSMRVRFGEARWARETEESYRDVIAAKSTQSKRRGRAALCTLARLWG